MGTQYRDLVRKHSKARGSARAVLNILADYADDDGLAWPGRAQLASDTGMSERNVIRCIQSLCDEDRLSIEENKMGGRGNKPHYKIWMPEIGQPAPPKEKRESVKGDKLSPERVSDCHPLDAERVTNEQIKGDKLSLKGDKSVEKQSYAGTEPHEPKKEPMGEKARAPNGAVTHAYFDPRKFVNGKVPAGTGSTPMEVFHEVHAAKDERHMLEAISLNAVTDTVSDLSLWREVVTAWALRGFKPTNVEGQLEWYKDPGRFRKNYNGNHSGNSSTDYQRPETSPYSMEEHAAHDAKRRAEGLPF